MKLVQPHGDVVNPVIIAGKSSIPKQLRGVEPLSKIMRREAEQVMGEDIVSLTEPDEQVTVNLTELLAADMADAILKRFNACDCHKCSEALSKIAAEKIPAHYVKVTKREFENGTVSDQYEHGPLRKTVILQMVRELMGNKRRNYHD